MINTEPTRIVDGIGVISGAKKRHMVIGAVGAILFLVMMVYTIVSSQSLDVIAFLIYAALFGISYVMFTMNNTTDGRNTTYHVKGIVRQALLTTTEINYQPQPSVKMRLDTVKHHVILLKVSDKDQGERIVQKFMGKEIEMTGPARNNSLDEQRLIFNTLLSPIPDEHHTEESNVDHG